MQLVLLDPLAQLTNEDRDLLWRHQDYCRQFPYCLPKIVASTDYSSSRNVQQLYKLICEWPDLEPEVGLELLDPKYCDPVVREYAVSQLLQLSDEDLMHYLFPLTQVLKAEPLHDSPLGLCTIIQNFCRFLMLGKKK